MLNSWACHVGSSSALPECVAPLTVPRKICDFAHSSARPALQRASGEQSWPFNKTRNPLPSAACTALTTRWTPLAPRSSRPPESRTCVITSALQASIVAARCLKPRQTLKAQAEGRARRLPTLSASSRSRSCVFGAVRQFFCCPQGTRSAQSRRPGVRVSESTHGVWLK